MSRQYFGIFMLAILLAVPAWVLAGQYGQQHVESRQDCPVRYYKDIPLDVEFGPGAEAITRCLENRHHARVVISVDATHPLDRMGNVRKDKATFLSNIHLMQENYEYVHDMRVGRDVRIVVVASSSGALLMTTHHKAWGVDEYGNPNPNPFRHLVEEGMAMGFEFYVCQMASRALGIDMENKIPGVKFVPGGQIAVADFQMEGYALIKP